MKKYDVVVIGSGVAGSTAAYRLRDGGKRIAVIEEDLWGGICPNKGCEPKKILLSALEVVERNNQLVGKGFDPIESLDWSELMDFKREYTDPFSETFKRDIQKHEIETIQGVARFVDSHHIQVEEETIEADVFIIATGQLPKILDIEGKEYLEASKDFLELDELPNKVTFIGAGYISCELAAIANAAGAEVTIIHHNDRPLKEFDEELVNDMVERYKAQGIRIDYNVDTQRVVKQGNQFVVEAEGYSNTADYVVCATGTIPNLKELEIDTVGVEHTKRGILTNDYLQTANEAIYACGDIIDREQPNLTMVAIYEGCYVAERILGLENPIAYPPVASIVNGSPKLAHIGVTTDEAKENPEDYTIKSVDMSKWFNYKRMNDSVAKAKLVFEDEFLVGASVLNSQADELINYLTLVIDKKVTHEELSRMIFGYPTIASDLAKLVQP